MTARRFPLWTLLGVVLVVALVAGSGVLSSSPPTAAQRAYAIESSIRCPSCEDLSVAESSASTAVTVRATVTQQIAAGRTDQQIESYLVDRYGTSIVLDPPARGWSLLVWLLPVVVGLVVLAALARVLIRRRTISDPDPVEPGGDPPLTPEAAEEQRHFLVQSLADADAEYLAGDLSDKDYLALRHRDMVRLSSITAITATSATTATSAVTASSVVTDGPMSSEAGLATTVAVADDPAPQSGPTGAGGDDEPAAEPASAPPSGRSRRSWWFLGGAVAAFAGALILAVSLFATDRQPGQSVTGSFAQTAQQQVEESLAQAATDENQGQVDQAAQLYQSVLTKHPDNEVAMAQLGWLEYQSGRGGRNLSLISNGRAKLSRAVSLEPTDYAARLYLGTVLLQQDGDAAGAVAQYQQFLADRPPESIVEQAAPEVRQAFQKAGVPVPPAVGA